MFLYFLVSNGLLVVVGTVCQIAVIIALRRNRNLRDGPFSLISHLTYVQVIKHWISLPIGAVAAATKDSGILCKFSIYSWFVTDHSAFILLTTIALDRYINIVHPFKAVTMASSFRRRAPFFAWFLAMVIPLPLILPCCNETIERNNTTESGPSNFTLKVFPCLNHIGDAGKLTVLSSVSAGIVAPTVLSSMCYMRIGHVIWTRRKKIPSSFGNQHRSKLKLVKMAFTVLILGELTWSPLAIGILLEMYQVIIWSSVLTQVYMCIASNFLFLGGILIPAVYASFSPEFRESLMRVFRLKIFTKRNRLQPELKLENIELKSIKLRNPLKN